VRDGSCPDGWAAHVLGDHLQKVLGGGTPSRRRPDYWGGEIPWASVKDMAHPRLERTQEVITEAGLSNSAANLVPSDTIVLATRMAVGAVTRTVRPTAINQDLKALFPKSSLSVDYLYYLMQMHGPRLALLSPGTTVSGLRLEALRALPILLPPPAEQRKIAGLLSSVDDAIEKTEAVIEQVQRVKQGLTQQLLTRGLPGRHTRFKQTEVGEIPEAWEVVPVGDCIARGPTNGLYRHLSEYGSGIPIVRIDDFDAGEFLRLSGFRRLRLQPSEVRRYELKPREVLINRVNSLPQLGKCALVPPLPEPTVYESNMMCLAANEERLLPEYLVLWLCSPPAVRQIQSRAKRAVAQASIDQDDVKTLLIPCPPAGEQATIVSAVAQVDSRLKQEQTTLGGLREAKESLMHVLLTGQVRVKVSSPSMAAGENQR